MIPYALMGAEIRTDQNKKIKIRLLELLPDGFTFRLAKGSLKEPQRVAEMQVLAYLKENGGYTAADISSFKIDLSEEKEFWTEFRVKINDPEFRTLSAAVSREYLTYIDLKLNADDADLSEAMCGYPAAQEEIFAGKFKEARKKKLMLCGEGFLTKKCPQLGIVLDHPGLYRKYLEKEAGAFFADRYKETGLSGHLISTWKVTHLYIGNAWCCHLFPGQEVLKKIIKKAERENLSPVLVLPPVREGNLEAFRNLISILPPMEIVVNDFGMLFHLSQVSKAEDLVLNYGTMLNRRRKDTRLSLKTGLQKEYLRQNSLNGPEFRKYLKDSLGVRRFSFEACGYEYEIPDEDADLHLPYYQMNTSGWCTLYAACRNGARGLQEEEKNCPGYCMKNEFLYPEFLQMTGRYNSLFGYDDRILSDPEYFDKMTAKGIRRIVLEVLG